eukprot:2186725-Rhodomonas_salina.2
MRLFRSDNGFCGHMLTAGGGSAENKRSLRFAVLGVDAPYHWRHMPRNSIHSWRLVLYGNESVAASKRCQGV